MTSRNRRTKSTFSLWNWTNQNLHQQTQHQDLGEGTSRNQRDKVLLEEIQQLKEKLNAGETWANKLQTEPRHRNNTGKPTSGSAGERPAAQRGSWTNPGPLSLLGAPDGDEQWCKSCPEEGWGGLLQVQWRQKSSLQDANYHLQQSLQDKEQDVTERFSIMVSRKDHLEAGCRKWWIKKSEKKRSWIARFQINSDCSISLQTEAWAHRPQPTIFSFLFLHLSDPLLNTNPTETRDNSNLNSDSLHRMKKPRKDRDDLEVIRFLFFIVFSCCDIVSERKVCWCLILQRYDKF